MNYFKTISSLEKSLLETTLTATNGSMAMSACLLEVHPVRLRQLIRMRGVRLKKIREHHVETLIKIHAKGSAKEKVRGPGPESPSRPEPEWTSFKRMRILQALREHGFRRTAAADFLGINRTTLSKWIRELRAAGFEIPCPPHSRRKKESTHEATIITLPTPR